MQGQLTGDDDLWPSSTIRDLITEIESVRSAVLEREAVLDLGQFGDHVQSTRNLVHYLHCGGSTYGQLRRSWPRSASPLLGDPKATYSTTSTSYSGFCTVW